MLDFAQFQWLSFDCYGTLIDWESGILGYLRPLLRSKQCNITDDQILSLYSEVEPRQQAGEYRSYREILARVVTDFAREFHFAVTNVEAAGLADSIRSWQPFPDTIPALQRLHPRYKLAILSNTDDDLFAATARTLQVPFDAVITAEQARSYKPAPHNFELALERLGAPPERVLHLAQSLYHDHMPARALGLHSVWINRHGRSIGTGATLADEARPDAEFPDLMAFAEAVESGA